MFITFEGGEGSGKTSLIEMIKDTLIKMGIDVVTTREPGGSVIAEQIRRIILDNQNTAITPHTEALLFAASRAQHLDEVIIPAKKEGKLILCDRYLDSSLAYQAYGRNLGEDFVLSINRYATDHMPDLTFYIDVDPEIGIARVKKNRTHKSDRLDVETHEFHKRVREGYLELVCKDTNRVVLVNGNQSIDAIYEIVMNKIKERL
ncbi:MAG TPA: dTMP kinase [Acholeplasma sp.]